MRKGAASAVSETSARIGVLTFHRCINYGSWQARCLVEGLASRGLNPLLLDHRSRAVDRKEWRTALSPAGSGRPTPDLYAYRRKIRLFNEAIESTLPLSAPFALSRPREAGVFDTLLVGSDEVWNFRHPWYGNARAFFGDSFRTRRLAAYAASFGAHDAEAGVGPEWSALLRRFSAISVRDENSRRLISAALGEAPSLALDPCLQFPRAAAVPNAPDSGEILIYGHGFPAWFQNAVRAFAVAVGAPLVSFGYHNEWADEQRIAEGPESFARAMAASRAVATNFFHGCVFSVLNRRPFVAALSPYRANKVSDLLHRLGLQSRLLDENAPVSRYASALTEPPEAAVEDRLARLRTASDRFLERALGAQ